KSDPHEPDICQTGRLSLVEFELAPRRAVLKWKDAVANSLVRFFLTTPH
ncbi:MAG: hypothetical protein RL661_553, partial [Pseudomonadota bacterium]